MMEKEISKMEKYSSYHIQTDGFQHVLVGMAHMARAVLPDRKCRVVIDYDPALPKVSIETFTDKSDGAQALEKEEVGKKKSRHRACRESCGCDYIFSREIPVAETTLQKDEIDRMKKSLLYAIGKDNETGEVKICPMNEENCIVIHGAEEAAVFIYRLLDHFQT